MEAESSISLKSIIEGKEILNHLVNDLNNHLHRILDSWTEQLTFYTFNLRLLVAWLKNI